MQAIREKARNDAERTFFRVARCEVKCLRSYRVLALEGGRARTVRPRIRTRGF